MVESTASDSFDFIMKPRTNYSSNVLRRALPPGVNIQHKKDSITMVKLKVLTSLKLGEGGGRNGGESGQQMPRKVKTVQQIPKILTIISPASGKKGGDQLMKVVSGIGI
jgi:hypothetical protein